MFKRATQDHHSSRPRCSMGQTTERCKDTKARTTKDKEPMPRSIPPGLSILKAAHLVWQPHLPWCKRKRIQRKQLIVENKCFDTLHERLKKDISFYRSYSDCIVNLVLQLDDLLVAILDPPSNKSCGSKPQCSIQDISSGVEQVFPSVSWSVWHLSLCSEKMWLGFTEFRPSQLMELEDVGWITTGIEGSADGLSLSIPTLKQGLCPFCKATLLQSNMVSDGKRRCFRWLHSLHSAESSWHSEPANAEKECLGGLGSEASSYAPGQLAPVLVFELFA